MIPVRLQNEPAAFDSTVRQPGRAFLTRNPTPTNDHFKKNSFWKRAAAELYAAYHGVCAYSCFYLPPSGTIDHFLPKSLYRAEAYEWKNFRLASHRLNNYKANSTEVIDPFVVRPGWFVLDFPSCVIKFGPGLSDVVIRQVERTIEILHLNDDDYLVQERCNLMMDYALGNVSLDFLSRRYPFLAVEIKRQDLIGKASGVFKMPKA